MSPEEQMSDDEMKMEALKLIQKTWKTITAEKQKGTDVAVAEEKIVAARAAIKDKNFQSAYENATAGSAELDKALGIEPEATPIPTPTPTPAPVPTPTPEPAPVIKGAPSALKEEAEVLEPEAPAEVPAHDTSTDTFEFTGGEATPMPKVAPDKEVDAESILAQPEEEKEPAPPKPVLFLCYNCNEPISVTVPERPLIVKCPNCGIDGQID